MRLPSRCRPSLQSSEVLTGTGGSTPKVAHSQLLAGETVNTGIAEVVQLQESRRILEGSQSIPKKLPGFKDVILMSASNRHYNFQRVQKFKFLFLTDRFIEHHKRTISTFCEPPFIGSLDAF